MIIDIIRLYNDRGVRYELPGHKHVTDGWVGVPCPFCSGNPGYHLGYCTDPGSRYAGRYVCWRCGPKKTLVALGRILSTDENETRHVLHLYRQDNGALPAYKPEIKRRRELLLPAGTDKMTRRHRDYLQQRQFDPNQLEQLWELQGTGPVGDYKHRIIIPIRHRGKLVSYQGRDITGKSGMKYKACRQEHEVIEHKHCLYGLDKAKRDRVIVVEGVTDVWRLGPGAVATFGVKFKPAQVALLLRFKRVFILFDPDPEAQHQAELLGTCLAGAGRDIQIIQLDGTSGDPADLPQQEADDIVAELLGK